jgi:hypothetical protein
MAYKEQIGSEQLGVNSVENSALAQMAANTIKGNDTGGSADPQDLTKTEVLVLLNVEDGADVTDATNVAAAGAQMTSEKNANNGYAGLDAGGKVASAQLPSYVDDVIEVADFASLPATGETGKIYVTIDDGKIFRWTGSVYVEISADAGAPVSSVNTQTGAVVLDADDISDAATTNKFVTAGDITNLGNLSNTNSGDEVQGTTTTVGIWESATVTEINTGTSTTLTLTPSGLAGSQLATDVTANNLKVSAGGLVTTHSDVTSAGSGAIITTDERSKLSRPVVSKTFADTNYFVSNYEIVNYDTTGGASTIILPLVSVGAIVSVKMGNSTNTLTVDGNGTETIDGQLTYSCSNTYQAVNFVANEGGTSWMVM